MLVKDCSQQVMSFFLQKKDQKILWCQIDFFVICNFFWSNLFLDQVPNQSFCLLNPCQSWTKIEESRLWGSQLDGWLKILLQNSLVQSLDQKLVRIIPITMQEAATLVTSSQKLGLTLKNCPKNQSYSSPWLGLIYYT